MKVYAQSSAWTAMSMLVLGAGICWGQLQPQQTMQYPQPAPTRQSAVAPRAQNPALSDAEIQEKVQNQLDADPALKAAGVSATVTNGKVQLMGMVPDHNLKARAAALAHSVAGVQGVQNLISINSGAAAQPAANTAASPYGPSAESAAEPNGLENGAQGMTLQNRINQALAADPVLSRYPIIATINKNNDVLLRGTVPSKMDKRQAQNVAQAMAGVHHVENHLKVSAQAANGAGAPQAGPSSAPSARPAGDTLASQSGSGDATPVLPSQSPSGNPASSASASGTMARMQQVVSAALAGDPVLAPYHIAGVVTGPGSVTLEGTVPGKADRRHAQTLVEGIAGVRHVHNQIQVDGGVQPEPRRALPDGLPPGSDPPPAGRLGAQDGQNHSGATTPAAPQDLRTELQARLQGNPSLAGVVVYVNGHTVTLRGNVATRAEQKQAARMVKSALPKNYQVRNHIAINHGMGNGYPPLR